MKTIAIVFTLLTLITFQGIAQEVYPTFLYEKPADTLIWSKAWDLYTDEKFSESLKVLAKLTKGYNSDPAVLRLKSLCHAGLKDYEAALETVGQAIAHAPESYGLLNERSYIWAMKKNYRAQAADLAAYLTFDPENYYACFNYGSVLDEIGERAKAISFLEAYKGKESDIRVLLAEFYAKDRRYDSAISILHDVIELDPGYESAYSNLAICYQKSGDSEKALYLIDRLLAMNPN